LENLKGCTKVYRDLFKEQGFEKPQPGLSSKFVPETVEWLKGYGITDGGFSPPSLKGEDVDQYTAKVCEVAITGLSGLAKTSEVVDKYVKIIGEKAQSESKTKWLLKEKVMLPAYQDWVNFKVSIVGGEVIGDPYETWLTNKKTELIKQTRILQMALARIKFAMVIGHAWFKDIPFDNPVKEIEYPGIEKPVKFTIKLYDKTIGKAAD
jgi:hypothetical protein